MVQIISIQLLVSVNITNAIYIIYVMAMGNIPSVLPRLENGELESFLSSKLLFVIVSFARLLSNVSNRSSATTIHITKNISLKLFITTLNLG